MRCMAASSSYRGAATYSRSCSVVSCQRSAQPPNVRLVTRLNSGLTFGVVGRLLVKMDQHGSTPFLNVPQNRSLPMKKCRFAEVNVNLRDGNNYPLPNGVPVEAIIPAYILTASGTTGAPRASCAIRAGIWWPSTGRMKSIYKRRSRDVSWRLGVSVGSVVTAIFASAADPRQQQPSCLRASRGHNPMRAPSGGVSRIHNVKNACFTAPTAFRRSSRDESHGLLDQATYNMSRSTRCFLAGERANPDKRSNGRKPSWRAVIATVADRKPLGRLRPNPMGIEQIAGSRSASPSWRMPGTMLQNPR